MRKNLQYELCVLFIIMLFIVVGCARKQKTIFEAETFAYTHLAGGAGYFLDVKNNELGIGDVTVSAKYCDKISDYYCVNSAVFSFAVPKQFDHDKTSWEQDGHKYNVVLPIHRKKLFGQMVNIEVISTVSSGNTDKPAPLYLFFYSPERGLLAVEYTTSGDTAPSIVISTDPIGFGATVPGSVP